MAEKYLQFIFDIHIRWSKIGDFVERFHNLLCVSERFS